jgi:uncharacterized protein
MQTNLSPIGQSERIGLIDALRGLAIFGILMVNMPLMFQPISQMMLGPSANATTLQIISESFIKFFFEGKFYVLFSFLFGYGFWIFLSKPTADGQSIVPVFRRRIFFLLLFGIAHITLLWAGDILFFYALFGFVLILFRNSSDKKAFRWAIGFILLPIVLNSLMVGMFSLVALIPEAQAGMHAEIQQSMESTKELIAQSVAAYTEGSYIDTINARINEWLELLPALFFFYPVVLGMFLLGMLAARKRLIVNYQENLPLFRKLFWIGLIVGLVANTTYTIAYRHTIMTIPNGWYILSTTSHIIGGISFGMMYVSIVALLFAKGKQKFLTQALAPVGRMALTNYLLHSIITAILFLPFGFGLFGKMEVWQGIVLTVLIFALQIPFSRFWLNRFHYGPFEWFWRSLTYMKIQPFQKDEKNS